MIISKRFSVVTILLLIGLWVIAPQHVSAQPAEPSSSMTLPIAWPWSKTVTVQVTGKTVDKVFHLKCERATLEANGKTYSGAITNQVGGLPGRKSCSVEFKDVPVNVKGKVTVVWYAGGMSGNGTYKYTNQKDVTIGKPGWGSTVNVGEISLR